MPACVATLSPQISPWTKLRRKDARARVFMCKRVRVRVPVSFPSALGSPAALALQHGAAVCAVGPPLWGEPAQSSGCDGRERRSGGGALYGSTALPAVEGTPTTHTHTSPPTLTHARARAHTHTFFFFTPAVSPNEKAQRMCVNDESQRFNTAGRTAAEAQGASKTRQPVVLLCSCFLFSSVNTCTRLNN